MGKNLTLIAILVIALVSAANAQPPEEIWNQHHGSNANDWCWSMVQAPDGGYAMAGITNGLGAGDVYLVKTDLDGNLDWWENYGGNMQDYATMIVNVAGGGYAMIARTLSFGAGNSDFWLIRVDEEGNDIWGDDRRVFGGELYDGALNWWIPLLQLGNGDFAFGGSRQVRRDNEITWDGVILLTDENGEDLRDYSFGEGGTNELFSRFIETEAGLLAVGTTQAWGANRYDVWLQMIDPEDGEELWSNVINLENEEMGIVVAPTSDGGYVIAGEEDPENWVDVWQETIDALLVKTDERGELLWSRTYGGNNLDVFYDVIELHNGAFALVGRTFSFNVQGGGASWFMITDELGDSLWSVLYPGDINHLFDAIIELDNHEIVIAGCTVVPGAGAGEFQLIKFTPPGFTFLEGHVFDASDDNPLEGVQVMVGNDDEIQKSAVTDSTGFYRLSWIWADNDILTTSLFGYNDSTLTDLEFEPDDTVEIDFHLLHPKMTLDPGEISVVLGPDESAERSITVGNTGNGPLEWSVEPRLTGEAGVDPWNRRQSFLTGATVEDSRLQGVVFDNGYYYVTGGGNQANVVYVLNEEGNLETSFPQFGSSNFGMADLTWDGELLWGVEEDTVYGFTTEGERRVAFGTESRSLKGIAWDGDSLLWVGNLTDDLKAFTREGVLRSELNHRGLRVYGLAYWQDDPDGYPLYIFQRTNENPQTVYKMDPATGEIMFVCELLPEDGGSAEGAFITRCWDRFGCWVFMDIANAGDDRIDVWQMKANTDWLIPEPSEGLINAGEQQELALNLVGPNLDPVDFCGCLVFHHNAMSAHDTVNVIMHLPVIQDNREPLPTDFAITSIYPNPFNSTTRISYSLPSPSFLSLQLFDVRGRRVETLFEGDQHAGLHSSTLSAANLPSGLYFVRLEASEKAFTRKVMLIR